MKIGDRVITVDGPGVIVETEDFKTKRYGVKIDGTMNTAYYFEKEILRKENHDDFNHA